jgi:hypothetical protein
MSEAEPVEEYDDKKKDIAQTDDKRKRTEPVEESGTSKRFDRFSKFGFLYSKKCYTVEQELKSVNADCMYEIMNCPFHGGNGSQTLGHEYDCVYLSNSQQGDQETDKPTVKRSHSQAKITSDYGVAVL